MGRRTPLSRTFGQAYDRVASQEELRDLRDEVKRRRSSGVVGEAEEVQALRQDLDDCGSRTASP